MRARDDLTSKLSYLDSDQCCKRPWEEYNEYMFINCFIRKRSINGEKIYVCEQYQLYEYERQERQKKIYMYMYNTRRHRKGQKAESGEKVY